ncbi:MAG: hypothetical protein V2J24_02760 [Pseudomonadales bacterium]|jgi:tetratricopeptide (TPR) repeat protein|nr:hypothetical protein [Pseudomonadales bacterium]
MFVRSKVRLRTAACALGTLTLLTVGGWHLAERRIADRCSQWLDAGRAELREGSALRALHALGRALREPACGATEDARAWTDYARARVRVRAPELAHVSEAISALRHAHALEPADPEIGTALAEALLGVGLHDEAAATADRVLDRSDHPAARRIAAGALLAAGRTRELLERLDGDRWVEQGFWFRATRLLLRTDRGPGHGSRVDRLLAAESDPAARAVLGALAGRTGPAPDPAALVAELTAPERAAAADVIGAALLWLQQLEQPALMLELLAHHAASLEGPLRTRLAALAWQADRRDLVAAALEAGPVALYETPELLAYGAIAGHAASVAAMREHPAQDTAVGRAWRSLTLAVLDASGPAAVADASTQVLRDAPGSALAQTLAAEAWLQLGELQRAEALASRAMRSEPFWSQPRLLRGVARAQRASSTDAVESGDAPCVASPELAPSYRACARRALPAGAEPWQVLLVAIGDATRAGDLRAADELVEALRATSPGRATLWRLASARTLLATRRREEDTARAALRLREVLEILPRHAEARMLLGLALARLRDYVAGRADVLEAVKLAPELWREGLRMAVLIDREQQDGGGAELVQLARRVIARAPLSETARHATETRWLRSLLVATEGERTSGLQLAAYARLVELEPDLDFALNNYAWLLYEKREALATALELAGRAVALAPDNAAYGDTLVAVRRWANDVEDAERVDRARTDAALEAARARIRRQGAARRALVASPSAENAWR